MTLCTTGPAAAHGDAPRRIGDWTLTVSEDGKGCFLTRSYPHPGDTTLLFGLDSDGSNRLSVLNTHWSIQPRQRLKLDFRLSNSSYPAHFAVGIVSDGQQGFVTSFGARFPAYLAASDMLRIARGPVAVERLSLDGADAAIAKLRQCVDHLPGEPARAHDRKPRSTDIPADPFASEAVRDSKN